MTDETETLNSRCPSCGEELADKAVLCLDCGYHLEKGTHLSRVVATPPPSATNSSQRDFAADNDPNPYRAPRMEPLPSVSQPGWMTFLLQFWIRGRIPRWQWWAYTAGGTASCFGTIAIDSVLFNRSGFEQGLPLPIVPVVVIVSQWLIITAQVKRWHDIDKSGWWFFVNWIPVIGPFYALVECGFEPGTKGTNDYGEDPLEHVGHDMNLS